MAKTHSHSVVLGSTRSERPGFKAVGPANPNREMDVTIKLRRMAPLPDLATRPAKAMTRQQLAQAHGASPADIKKVTAAFTKFGLKAIETDAAKRTVHLVGSVADMEAAFLVKLLTFQRGDETYRGRVGPYHVPEQLADIVEGVFGLDNRRMVRRKRHPIRDARRKMMGKPSGWYIGSELASHYKFPAGDGKGQTVAILEFGGGYFESDLKKYCKLAAIAVPKVIPISVDGTSTSSDDDAAGEVMLDVEVVAGVCPKANIAVYFATWSEQGWLKCLDAAIHDAKNDPGVISISWGYPEGVEVWTASAMKQIDEALKEAAHLGITVCVASGDDGSSDAMSNGHAYTDFPSSSPYALAVGGTTIPSKTGSKPDIVWKEGTGLRDTNGGSSGGGVSAVFARPTWQKAVTIKSVNPNGLLGRCVPDVAANADWDASPYLLVLDGQSNGNGGTSAATPLWAALLTRINAKRKNRVGYITPVLYGSNGKQVGAQGCTDVTAGDNVTAKVGGYQAKAGYDAVTGWGTPNGTKLSTLL